MLYLPSKANFVAASLTELKLRLEQAYDDVYNEIAQHAHVNGAGAQIAHGNLSGIDPASSTHVTNGDAHNHLGGDGGTIAHSSLSVATLTWTEPTLLNSWAHYNSAGGTFERVAYVKDAHGFVHIRGLAKDGTLATALFTLPLGSRPAYKLIYGGISILAGNPVLVRVDIEADGDVLVDVSSQGSNTWMSISGIYFYAG